MKDKWFVGIISLLLLSFLSVVNSIGAEVTPAITPTPFPDGGPTSTGTGKIYLLNNKKTIKLGRSFMIKVTGYRKGCYVYHKNRKNIRKPMDKKDLLKKELGSHQRTRKLLK